MRIVSILLASMVLAQQQPPEAHLTADQRAQIWRKVAEVRQAQIALAEANDSLNRLNSELAHAVCGAREIIPNASGEPDCPPKEKVDAKSK